MSCITVGVVKTQEAEQEVTTTKVFDLPFLTNCVDVEAGEELIVEVEEKTKPKAEPVKRTWKHVAMQEDKGAKTARKDQYDGIRG